MPSQTPAEAASVQPGAEPRPAARRVLPIVGIGASAGGLEALEEFLQHVPARSGLAYVIVQHLDPTHKGAMVELLQRVSPIPVAQVKDRTKVEPDCVYVIPPNKDMSVLHGVLHLLPQTAPRGLNLPIDFFFRSLAEDQQERSIGVIFSGMGSDGTLGLRAIKEKGGAAFVQSLASAKFNGMPRSAIGAGLADVVAAAGELPQRIAAYHQHAPYSRPPETAPAEKQLSALEKIFILLRAHTGNDFSLYKTQHDLPPHRAAHGPPPARQDRQLRALSAGEPREVELLFKELLIGVTSFFRDPPAWDRLSELLPDLLRSRPAGGVLRAWVPGCSTGEEAYSLAIVLAEAIEKLAGPRVSRADLRHRPRSRCDRAGAPGGLSGQHRGRRLPRAAAPVLRPGRARLPHPQGDPRDRGVRSAEHRSWIRPSPSSTSSSCRNLLIYLSPELQKKLIPLFHYA